MIDIYLCDDDEPIRRRIEAALKQKILIEDYDMQIVCSTGAPENLLEHLKTGGQNLYFLDVELQDGQWDGFLLGREIRRQDPRGILVYITSYGDLACRTFQYHLEAFDYIVKTSDRLEASLSDCLKALQDRLMTERQAPVQVYPVRTGSALRYVPLQDILFFETAPRPHHVLLHTVTGRMDFLGSLNEIEAELKGRFLRTHRAYLVALDKIEAIDLKKGKLLAGGMECLISRAAKPRLLELAGQACCPVPFRKSSLPFRK